MFLVWLNCFFLVVVVLLLLFSVCLFYGYDADNLVAVLFWLQHYYSCIPWDRGLIRGNIYAYLMCL